MSARKPRWYVIAGSEFSQWTIEVCDYERGARSKAEAWARQGKVCTVARSVAGYEPASKSEEHDG